MTTAPVLSSGIHLPVTLSIYEQGPSRSLGRVTGPFETPPCITVVHLPEVTPAMGFFFLFLFTICQPTSCFKLLYFSLAVGDGPYNIRRCVALTKGGEEEWGGGELFIMIYGEGYYEKQNGRTSRRYLIRASPKLLLKMHLQSRLSRVVLRCTACGSHESSLPLMNLLFACLSQCAVTSFSQESCQYTGHQTVHCDRKRSSRSGCVENGF